YLNRHTLLRIGQSPFLCLYEGCTDVEEVDQRALPAAEDLQEAVGFVPPAERNTSSSSSTRRTSGGTGVGGDAGNFIYGKSGTSILQSIVRSSALLTTLFPPQLPEEEDISPGSTSFTSAPGHGITEGEDDEDEAHQSSWPGPQTTTSHRRETPRNNVANSKFSSSAKKDPPVWTLHSRGGREKDQEQVLSAAQSPDGSTVAILHLDLQLSLYQLNNYSNGGKNKRMKLVHMWSLRPTTGAPEQQELASASGKAKTKTMLARNWNWLRGRSDQKQGVENYYCHQLHFLSREHLLTCCWAQEPCSGGPRSSTSTPGAKFDLWKLGRTVSKVWSLHNSPGPAPDLFSAPRMLNRV
ncbi:unnamed protein product, partial [Amoebophrya sp. A120]